MESAELSDSSFEAYQDLSCRHSTQGQMTVTVLGKVRANFKKNFIEARCIAKS